MAFSDLGDSADLTRTQGGSRLGSAFKGVAHNPPTPLPACVECVSGLQIEKEDRIITNGCWLQNRDEPYQSYTWFCRRFNYNDGKFYYIQTAYSENEYIDSELIGVCPNNSCNPTPAPPGP